MDSPPDETPDPVQNIIGKATGFLSTYGWSCLFVVIVANLIWSHFYPKYKKWREKLENEKLEAEYQNDPSRLIAREEAMALARQRLQEKHDKLAREYEEKMREKEEKKRQEKLEAMENLMRGKSTKPKASNESQNLRQEYNPLTGSSGGSCSFRPSSRRGGAGGG